MNRFQRLLRWGSVSSVAMLGLMLVLFSSPVFHSLGAPVHVSERLRGDESGSCGKDTDGRSLQSRKG
jgi:hypothetical protein